jgi:hypothetical protein
LVLLCQGLLFENSEADVDTAVTSFGVLIIVIVTLCLLMTTYSVIVQALKPTARQLTLPRKSAQRLPRNLHLELYILNSLSKMDFNRELEVNLGELQLLLTKNEVEELTSARKNAVKIEHQVVTAELYGDGSYPLETILPLKSGGHITPQIISAQNKMFLDFALSFKAHV